MTTKQALLNAIEQLPEEQLIEVLQYVEHLSHAQELTQRIKPDLVVDPLAEFIGTSVSGQCKQPSKPLYSRNCLQAGFCAETTNSKSSFFDDLLRIVRMLTFTKPTDSKIFAKINSTGSTTS